MLVVITAVENNKAGKANTKWGGGAIRSSERDSLR